MRGIAHLFVALQLRRNVSNHHCHGLSSSLSLFPSPLSAPWKQSELEEKLDNLIQATAEVGSVGSLASKEDQKRIQDLADAMIPHSLPLPALYPLQG
jgi:hypothetical protein